jgi:hypothetical protein
LGDIWETGNSKLDDNKGSTLVHIWTAKGKAFLDDICDSVRMVDYPIEQSRGTERKHTLKLHPSRELLFVDANNMAPSEFFAKYAPYSLKVRIKNYGRYILWCLNIQSFVRHLKHKVIHR